MCTSNRYRCFSIRIRLFLVAIALSSHCANGAEPVGPVDQDDLTHAAQNDSNWLMYDRGYDSQRYSKLDKISRANVSKLIPIWSFQTGVLDGFECTPLVPSSFSATPTGGA